LRSLQAFVNTLNNWREGILNYFNGRHSNGFAEGVNLKIKMLKRRGFGYRNFAHFRLYISCCIGAGFPLKTGESVLFKFRPHHDLVECYSRLPLILIFGFFLAGCARSVPAAAPTLPTAVAPSTSARPAASPPWTATAVPAATKPLPSPAPETPAAPSATPVGGGVRTPGAGAFFLGVPAGDAYSPSGLAVDAAHRLAYVYSASGRPEAAPTDGQSCRWSLSIGKKSSV
jgi:hypothetical protein